MREQGVGKMGDERRKHLGCGMGGFVMLEGNVGRMKRV